MRAVVCNEQVKRGPEQIGHLDEQLCARQHQRSNRSQESNRVDQVLQRMHQHHQIKLLTQGRQRSDMEFCHTRNGLDRQLVSIVELATRHGPARLAGAEGPHECAIAAADIQQKAMHWQNTNLIQPNCNSARPRHAGTGPLVKAELLGTARLAVHRIAGIDLLGLVAPVIGDRLLNGAAALAGVGIEALPPVAGPAN